jgi:ribosome-binding factor A
LVVSGWRMDERRTLRVSEAVREELAEIIAFEMQDPRVLDVDVTEVHVSGDGRYATIKVAIRGDDRRQKDALAGLDHARHYLRHELGARLALRLVPELHFERDRNPDAASRVEFLIKRAKKSQRRTENRP